MNETPVLIGNRSLTVYDIEQIAKGRLVELANDEAFRAKISESEAHLKEALANGDAVYGVTTGFGGSCGNRFDKEKSQKLGLNLIRYHHAGVGEPFHRTTVRAALACRLNSLAQGYSGVSLELLQALVRLINADITPIVPSQGSVGASGDLTPMAYVAGVLMGEGEVLYDEKRMSAEKALNLVGLLPYTLKPKEPLALLNGTPFMTGLAALNIARAERFARAALTATALSVHAIGGHVHHFDETIFQAKPHPGSAKAASRLRTLLKEKDKGENTFNAAFHGAFEASAPEALQDPYSIRCAPQVIGVLLDALEWITQWVTLEVNSANDNPLVDKEDGRILMGGNFYGGHIAMAMDALKANVASVTDMQDRQLALLVDPRFSRGLAANLVSQQTKDATLNHGFKGLQITSSALCAECLKNTMPMSAFSRSTESHNQDKVPMGTIAARDAAHSLDMAMNVSAIHLFAASQASRIRGNLKSRSALKAIVESVFTMACFVKEDRNLDIDVQTLSAAIEAGFLDTDERRR